MYNIFEQPWVLIAVSFAILVVVYVVRTSFPQKQKWWHLLIPALVFASAFGVDHLVRTDHEKVKSVLENVITATMEKNTDAIDPLIAEDYWDRHHPTKQSIMNTFNFVVKRHSIRSIVMTYHDIVVENDTADAEILVRLRMDPKNTSMPTPEFNFAKLKLTLNKKTDATWKIKSTQLVEVNKSPVNWKRAR